MYPDSVALGQRSAAVLESVVFHRLTAGESAEELLKQSLSVSTVRAASRFRLIDDAEELQSKLHIPRTATSFDEIIVRKTSTSTKYRGMPVLTNH